MGLSVIIHRAQGKKDLVCKLNIEAKRLTSDTIFSLHPYYIVPFFFLPNICISRDLTLQSLQLFEFMNFYFHVEVMIWRDMEIAFRD